MSDDGTISIHISLLILITSGVTIPLVTWLIIVSFKAGTAKRQVSMNRMDIKKLQDSVGKVYVEIRRVHRDLEDKLEKHKTSNSPHDPCLVHTSTLGMVQNSISYLEKTVARIDRIVYAMAVNDKIPIAEEDKNNGQ